MTLAVEKQAVTAERLTLRASISFTTAESRLRSSIQTQSDAWKTFQDDKEPARPTDQASFAAWTEKKIGPHGFMYFNEYQHGAWLPFYAPPTATVTDPASGEKKFLKCTRFILGNPLIAITMLRHDLDAGLCVPVELYLVEEANGGSRIVWYKPVGLIAGFEGAKPELVEAAEALSKKLEALVRWVLREGGGESL
jgi:hypothetical protein